MKRNLIKLSGLVAVAAVMITGCDPVGSSGTPSQPASAVLVAQASPDASPISVTLNGGTINNFPYGGYTPYNIVNAGTQTFSVTKTGASGKLLDTTFITAEGKYYSLFLVDSLSRLRATIIQDPVTAVPMDSAKIRFLHLAPAATTVDLAMTGGAVLSANRHFNDQRESSALANFTQVKSGTYNLEIRKSGTNEVLVTLPNLNFQSQNIYTIFSKDSTNTSGAKLVSYQLLRHQQ